MDTMHRSPGRRRPRKYCKSLKTLGRTIDLYLSTQAHVVKTNYLLSDSMTVEDQEQCQELRTEILNNQLRAKKKFQTLKLPRWRSLPEDLRQIFITAAVGNLGEAVAVTCNLGPKAAKRASEASRGSADYVGRKLRGLTCIAPELALVLEDAAHRQGCNPGLHFHAALRIHADQFALLDATLVKLFASDYVEVADNKAVVIKPIREPGRWGTYCSKTLLKANQVDRAVFATNDSRMAGKQLYNEVMRWLRQLPAPEVLQVKFDGLLRQSVFSLPNPGLVQLIRKHDERRREAKRLRNKRARQIRKLAAANPDQVKQELTSTLLSACESAANTPSKSPAEHAGDTIVVKRNDYSTQRAVALTERYSGLPGVGVWSSNERDEAPILQVG